MSRSILERTADTAERGPQCILVVGATGGIGGAFCRQLSQQFPSATIARMARDPGSLETITSVTVDIHMDIGDEQRIRDGVAQIPDTPPIDWIFIATGWLHDNTRSPEKT